MNIAIVCYPTFGGSGVLATELGKALAEKGHQIHFITYQQPVRLSGFNANIFYHEVLVPTYPLFDYPPYESALAGTLVDVISNYHIDILHVHYAIPHAAAAFMAKQIVEKSGKKIPVITTLHGTDITLVGKDKIYRPVVTFSMEASDALTAVSSNLRDETYKHFEIEKEIRVIHNFVDTQRFSRSSVKCLKEQIAPKGERILLHASNFRPVKRVIDVVETFYGVRKKIPAKLVLIGDGPDRPEIETFIRAGQFAEDIRLLGKQEQMEEILPVGDLFLLPSEYESFGLAALEAMAAGVPVVSSDAGGLPEIILPGVSGYLCGVGDVTAMSEKALDILINPDRLEVFKKNARNQANVFSISRIVPQYEALYSELVVR